MLLSYIKRYKPSLNTYITGFDEGGYNEFKYAETVTNYLNINPPKKLKINENEYIDAIKKQLNLGANQFQFLMKMLFFKCQTLKKDISVVMSGEGADELFVGMEEYSEVLMTIICQKPLIRNFVNYSF